MRIIMNGVKGAMGQAIVSYVSQTQDMAIVAGADAAIDENNKGSFDFPVYTSVFNCEEDADVIIDFSRPESLDALLAYARMRKMPIVIATTGFSKDQAESIAAAANDIPVFMSANMSLGVNLQMDLIARAAAFLGEAFNIEIVETHHNRKIDAPSGTALALAKVLSDTFATPCEYVYGRQSKNQRRKTQEIGIHALRGGTVAGEHKVMFFGDNEEIQISHRAQSRAIFAKGALRAAEFILNKRPGLYDMQDVVNEHNTLTAIKSDSNQALATLSRVPHDPSLIADIFRDIAMAQINIDIISQAAPHSGAVDISFSLHSEQVELARSVLAPIAARHEQMELSICDGITKLTMEGIGMQRAHGVAAGIFGVFAQCDIKIVSITTAETQITVCLNHADVANAVRHISEQLLL